MEKNVQRDYAKASLKEHIEYVIRDAQVQGTVTMPLRTEGYHKCSNLLYTDRL